jgi:peptidoglycan/LPS O-acetylase OafA/YrhL
VLPPGAFRLLLAIAVVLSHISGFDVGRLAVLLFFYLSGYWTTIIWNQKFGPGSELRFYAARYLRIAPLFLLVTFGSALLRGLPIAPENVTLLGVASTGRDPTGVSWSLDIELQYYLLVPLIVRLIPRFNAWSLVALSLVVAAIGLWAASTYSLWTIARFLPPFLLGALTASLKWRPGRTAASCSLIGFLVFSLITAMSPFLSKATPDPFDHDIWGFVWMLPLLPYVAHSLTLKSSRLDRHLGNLSYPLYLVHYPLIALATAHFGGSWTTKLAAVSVAFTVALLIYVIVDRPLDRWRVRLTESRANGSSSSPG